MSLEHFMVLFKSVPFMYVLWKIWNKKAFQSFLLSSFPRSLLATFCRENIDRRRLWLLFTSVGEQISMEEKLWNKKTMCPTDTQCFQQIHFVAAKNLFICLIHFLLSNIRYFISSFENSSQASMNIWTILVKYICGIVFWTNSWRKRARVEYSRRSHPINHSFWTLPEDKGGGGCKNTVTNTF